MSKYLPNKRMQSDFDNRYAIASAADARRYEVLEESGN